MERYCIEVKSDFAGAMLVKLGRFVYGNVVANYFHSPILENVPKAYRDQSLPWTGERLVTTCHRPLVYEHLHRYALAVALAKGKRVLDIACGEGYGANLLARVASKVTGVDLDAPTIAHAKTKYRRRNLRFVRGSCTDIPCKDSSVDLVASFETIEHIAEHDAFLSEIKRVLTPAGIVVISSPHKAEYQRASEAANPFHKIELNHHEFIRLIRKTFKYHVVGRQRLVVGSWIAPDVPSAKVSTATFHGGFDGIEIERGVHRGVYSIAVCSDRPLPEVNFGVFENFRDSADTWNLLDTYDSPTQFSARINDLTQAGDQQSKQIFQLRHEAEEKARHIALLQTENDERVKQVAHFKGDAEEKAKHVALLQKENDERVKQVAHFRREADKMTHEVERLQDQFARQTEALRRATDEALDARWEALSLRKNALVQHHSFNSVSSRLIELENQIRTLESEQQHSREAVSRLLADLTDSRSCEEGLGQQLQTSREQLIELERERQFAEKRLAKHQKHLARLDGLATRRMILPFGRRQRRLRELLEMAAQT